MTARQPFQRLLAALAIASGSAAYGATGQPSPLLPVDSYSTPQSFRNAILSSAPAESAAVQLIAQKRGSDSGSRGSGGGRSSGGGRGSSGGSSSRGSSISVPRSSGGNSGRSSSPRISTPRVDSSPRISTPRVDSSPRISTPRVDSSPRISTPRVDSSPRISTPRVDTPRRIETPRVDTPRRIETPNVDTSRRTQTPRIDTPGRVETPRIDTNNLRDNVVPRTTNRVPDPTPRIDNRNNAGGSLNADGNRLDSNLRNRTQVDSNRRGDTNVDSNSRIDSRITPRNNLPNVGNRRPDATTGIDNAAERLRNNADRLRDRANEGTGNAADRLRDNANRLEDRATDRTNNAADRARDAAERTRDRTNDATGNTADRLRDNANRLEDRTTDRANNAADRARDAAERTRDRTENMADRARDNADRVRDRVGDDNNPLGNANRVDRDNLNPRLRDQLDRARDNANDRTRDAADRARDNAERVRDNADRARDRAGDLVRDRDRDGDRNRDILNIRDGVRPIVAGPGRIDADVRNRIEARERITVRVNNNRTVDLTPFNRPGLGRNFGRDNLADRRVALNGLLHTSRLNRNVRYNGRFNDWFAWGGNNYWRHNRWHRGYWNFNRWNGFYGPNWWGFGIGFGGRWGGGWNGWGGGWGGWGGGWGYPVAQSFGLSPWGMNYVGYGFGLYDYYNPYCYQPVPFYGGYSYDYTQPLLVSNVANNYGSSLSGTVVQSVEQPTEAEPDMALFDQARSSFTAGDYEKALQLTEQQIQKTPKDSILHEFRGLVLFALGRFEDASIPVYAVLAVGPGWDWATMSSLYPNVDVYASQLKALEDFHRSNQDNAAASFLLAYHYLTCGHNEAAAAQLDNVLRINPQDLVATRLLQALGDGTTRSAEEMPEARDDNPATMPLVVPDVPELPAGAMVTAEDLHGTWQAQNSKGKTFTLTLTTDGTFEWVSKDDQKTIDQKGVFGVEGESLAMEPDGGGVLVGKVSKPENGSFTLELVGGLPDDKALEFKRVN